LYLALATLAFGQLVDKLVFQADFLYGFGGSMSAKRLALFGYDFSSTDSYAVLITVTFLLVGLALLAVRRGAIGRLLIALRDSPAACGTLGLNQRWFRVGVFTASAGIAGLAGALMAGLEGGNAKINATQFATLQSLPLLLVAVVAGVTSISGAYLGGMLLMLLPVLQATIPSLAGLEFLVIGMGAILLGRDPNGLVNVFYRGWRAVGATDRTLAVVGRVIPRSQPAPVQPDGADALTTDDAVADGPMDVTDVSDVRVAGHGIA
jgi:branched-chain amino acid transport system permease protein